MTHPTPQTAARAASQDEEIAPTTNENNSLSQVSTPEEITSLRSDYEQEAA